MKKPMRHILGLGRGALLLAAFPVFATTAFLATSAAPAQAAAAASGQVSVPGHASRAVISPLASYAVENYENDGDCLGISGGKTHAPAVLWPCNTHPDQSWNMVGNKLKFQFKNGDGQCLGVSAGSTSRGAAVVAWTCQKSAANQYWSIDTPFHCNLSGVPYYFYPIMNNETKYVIAVSHGTIATGEPIVMWSFQNACNNQVWGLA